MDSMDSCHVQARTWAGAGREDWRVSEPAGLPSRLCTAGRHSDWKNVRDLTADSGTSVQSKTGKKYHGEWIESPASQHESAARARPP
jgi:hypothetical protein